MFSSTIRILFSSLLLSTSTVLADEFSPDYEAYNAAEYGKQPCQTFHSAPDLDAPLLHVNIWNEDKISASGSHIFLRHDGKKSSPLILDAHDLSVVYMDPVFSATSDIRIQQNNGKDYLTFYEGNIVDGHGDGFGIVMDSSYNVVYNISAQNLTVHSDLHEFQMTGHGTVLVTAYEVVIRNTRPWHGPSKGSIMDSVFQEIDLETKEVLFQWRALDHVDPSDSYERVGRKWDYFHLNSIQKTKKGNYLISARHTHSIYMINGQTGNVMWTLGGKKNQFAELDPGDAMQSNEKVLSFSWQHHARFFHDNENEITFFDNHVLSTTQNCRTDCSRGLHIRLDPDATPKPTVQMLSEFLHPQSLQAQSQGSVQPLLAPNTNVTHASQRGSAAEEQPKTPGNTFVGWGRCPSFTEHTPSGEVAMSVQFSPWHTPANTAALDNYRAYKMDWVGTPRWGPAIAARQTHMVDETAWSRDTTTVVYASWNGATEVREWVFVASNHSRGRDLHGDVADRVVATLPRAGFETEVALLWPAKFARAVALGRDGEIIGASGVVNLKKQSVEAVKSPVTSVQKGQGQSGEAADVVDVDEDFVFFSVPLGRHAALAGVMLVGLMLAAWLS